MLERLFARRPVPDQLSPETTAALTGAPVPEPQPEETLDPELLAVLARKVLQAHLNNRHQLMQAEPTDLRDLPPEEAKLLIRAMAAAGHADGGLDARERRRVQAALATTVLSEAERRELEDEIESPPCLESLVRKVEDPQTAVRFYAVSVAAAHRGKASNRSYLTYVAQRLALPSDVVVRLNRRFDVPV